MCGHVLYFDPITRYSYLDNILSETLLLELVRNLVAHGDAREWKWRENWRMEWVASTLTPPPNVVYPALLKLMRTPRLPAVDWIDAPTDLNGLVCFGERRNLVSARVPSRSARAIPNELVLAAMLLRCIRENSVSNPTPTILNEIFRGLSQTFHVHARTVSEIRTSPLPTTSVSMHCLPIILSFDVTISTTKSHNLKQKYVQNTHRCSKVRQQLQLLVSKTIKFMDKAEFIRFQRGWDEIRKSLVSTDSSEESRRWLASTTSRRSHS